MHHRLLLLLLLSSLTACQSPAQAQPLSTESGPTQTETSDSPDVITRYSLRALHYSNLFYQLDCLSGQGYCSQESFQALWQKLGWTPEDDTQLEAWKTLKAKYSQQIQLSQSQIKTPLPPHFEGLVIWDQIRQAALNSDTRQSLMENLSLVMQAQDAEALARILFHFEDRFFTWWDSTGQPMAERGAQTFASYLKDKGLTGLLQSAGSFYGAQLDTNSIIAFNFIARPNLGQSSKVNGEQVGNQSLIEIKEGAKTLYQMDVVIHELCHYLYRRAPRSEEALLIQRFSDLHSADAIAAYNLLNEALATAIGNGIGNRILLPAADFQRLENTEGSFYNDPWLDPLAKAIYPRVAEALQAGESVHSQSFVADYLKLAQQALGEKLQSPVPLLRVMGGAYEPELASAFQNFQRTLRIGAAWGANGLDSHARSTFENFTDLSGIVMVRPEHLNYLDEWKNLLGADQVQTIQSKGKTQNLVYGVKRSAASYIFVFVAPDTTSMNALVSRFAAQPVRFEGLMP